MSARIASPCPWAAFVLTRPLGATLGDSLDKPVADGGDEPEPPLSLSHPAHVHSALRSPDPAGLNVADGSIGDGRDATSRGLARSRGRLHAHAHHLAPLPEGRELKRTTWIRQRSLSNLRARGKAAFDPDRWVSACVGRPWPRPHRYTDTPSGRGRCLRTRLTPKLARLRLR